MGQLSRGRALRCVWLSVRQGAGISHFVFCWSWTTTPRQNPRKSGVYASSELTVLGKSGFEASFR